MLLRSARASAVAAALVGVLAGCGGSSRPFPAQPHRLVSDDRLSTDAVLALGYRPVAAVGVAGSPALARRHVNDLGTRTGGSANVDAIAGAEPDAIVAPTTLKTAGWAKQIERIAPTRYYRPGPDWRTTFRSVAEALGRRARADAIVAELDRRAAALRAGLAGKTIALVRIVAPQSFTSVNDDVPVARVYEHDLGLHNFHLRPPQYPLRCEASPSPPKPCSTNSLYIGLVSTLTGADALLVETGSASPGAVAAFERSPFFRGLPAVRAGRVAHASSFEELGPLGVGYLYSSVARAFGLTRSR